MKYLSTSFFLLLVFLACQKEESPNTYALINPAPNEIIGPCCPQLRWAQTGSSPTTIQLYADSSLTKEHLIHEEETTIDLFQFPVNVFPDKEYWLRLSGGNAEIISQFSVEPSLDNISGSHYVKITRISSNTGSPDSTIYSSMEIELLLKSEELVLKEEETGLFTTIKYSNADFIGNLEFSNENRTFIFRYIKKEDFFVLRFFPNGSDKFPIWNYELSY